jgi:hypothetical protein
MPAAVVGGAGGDDVDFLSLLETEVETARVKRAKQTPQKNTTKSGASSTKVVPATPATDMWENVVSILGLEHVAEAAAIHTMLAEEEALASEHVDDPDHEHGPDAPGNDGDEAVWKFVALRTFVLELSRPLN